MLFKYLWSRQHTILSSVANSLLVSPSISIPAHSSSQYLLHAIMAMFVASTFNHSTMLKHSGYGGRQQIAYVQQENAAGQ